MPKMEIKINVDYLKKYKEEKNLTNRELAKLMGVHESHISRILRKERNCGMKSLVRLMELKDFDVQKLLNK